MDNDAYYICVWNSEEMYKLDTSVDKTGTISVDQFKKGFNISLNLPTISNFRYAKVIRTLSKNEANVIKSLINKAYPDYYVEIYNAIMSIKLKKNGL